MASMKRVPPERLVSQAEMTTEIDAIVSRLFTEHGKAEYPLVYDMYFEAHPCIPGEDDGHILCVYEHVKVTLRKVISTRNPDRAGKRATAQLKLPGFDKVQDIYSTERGGITVAVRVVDLTREEAFARAKELRAMGEGAIEHANQLEAFAEKFLQD